MKGYYYFFAFLLVLIVSSCEENSLKNTNKQDLFSKFQNPPAEARPFVRWWWNGNKIKAKELDRQLESLKNVGFGGVEINPIAMPIAFDKSEKSLVWMSDEWLDMVVHAAKKSERFGDDYRYYCWNRLAIWRRVFKRRRNESANGN